MTNWLNILKMATNPKIIVVGGGLAGLSATIKIAEMGAQVDLFSIVPVKRSHSVCAQGGINAAKNLKGEGDSTAQHFDDTIYGGDFLANQPPVKAMCEAAPGIIDLLDRMGVPFNRTPEGLLDFRRFGGTLYNRTAFAGATTGQQLLYALDEQVRRHESEGKVKKFEHWEFLSAVLDTNGVCRGICAIDLRSMEVRTFPADARSSPLAATAPSSASPRIPWSAPARHNPRSISKARTTQMASSFRFTQPAFLEKTSCA